MDKTVDSIIESQFEMIETVKSSKELDLPTRIKLFSRLVNDVRGMARLELEHKKFISKAPEMARDIEPIKLISK